MSDKEIQELAEEARRLRELFSNNGTGGNATIHINMGGWGVVVAAAASVIAVMAVLLHGDRISDTRAEMRAYHAEMQQWEAWSREESQIMRGYIWQGKVPPMNPPPSKEVKK